MEIALSSGRPLTEYSPNFHVVLVEPEIPQNTGNIGRTCVATQSYLHLVGPMGFRITDKNLKRAGLDYWPHLWWQHHDNLPEALNSILANSPTNRPNPIFYFSTKAQTSIYRQTLLHGSILVFGKETRGLPDSLARGPGAVTIPQLGPVRSLNLATAVAISLYEGLRQIRHAAI